MLLLSVNAIFGAGFLFAGLRALRYGWPLVRHGWIAIQAQTAQPDYARDVWRRRVIAEGGRFLIGGLLWLGAGAGALAFSAYFTLQAIRLTLGAP